MMCGHKDIGGAKWWAICTFHMFKETLSLSNMIYYMPEMQICDKDGARFIGGNFKNPILLIVQLQQYSNEISEKLVVSR